MAGILSSLHRTFVPVGERRRQPKLKSDARGGTKAAPVPRGQRSKQHSIHGVAPAMKYRMASPSSVKAKHGALAVNTDSHA